MKLLKRCGCDNPDQCRHPWWYRFWLRGREFRASTRTRNTQAADRIATRRKAALLEGRESFTRVKSVKLSDHIKTYVAWSEIENRSAKKKDGRVLDGFLAFVGGCAIERVTAFDIERWKTARAKAVQKSTVNRELNVIRGCFSRAVEWGHLVASPVTVVKPYRVDNIRMRILSVEEIKKLLEACSPELALIARTTLESLMRMSEVLNLHIQDIGPTHATIVHSKSGKARRVPLTTELRADLLRRAHSNGFIFGRPDTGKVPTQEATSVAFGRLAKKIGLDGVSHHVLRHTGASAMVAAGISLRVVQEIGGWTSLRMLERYAHPTDGEMQRAVRVLVDATTGTNTGTAANRAIKNDEPDTRQRVVGLDDWAGVPTPTDYGGA
jgi:integrase